MPSILALGFIPPLRTGQSLSMLSQQKNSLQRYDIMTLRAFVTKEVRSQHMTSEQGHLERVMQDICEPDHEQMRR